MIEKFTDQAHQAIAAAQEEARLLNHDYVGGEHLLLGLLHDEGEGAGVAARTLEGLGVSRDALRQQVAEITERGRSEPSGRFPFTPRAKRVLELSRREALQSHHSCVGTGHLLLGLIDEGEGVAIQILTRYAGDVRSVRDQIVALLHDPPGRGETTAGRGDGS